MNFMSNRDKIGLKKDNTTYLESVINSVTMSVMNFRNTRHLRCNFNVLGIDAIVGTI